MAVPQSLWVTCLVLLYSEWIFSQSLVWTFQHTLGYSISHQLMSRSQAINCCHCTRHLSQSSVFLSSKTSKTSKWECSWRQWTSLTKAEVYYIYFFPRDHIPSDFTMKGNYMVQAWSPLRKSMLNVPDCHLVLHVLGMKSRRTRCMISPVALVSLIGLVYGLSDPFVPSH